MTWELNEAEHRLQIRCRETLTVAELEPLQAAAVAALADCHHLQLDLAEVEEIDTAALQWLLVLQRHCIERDIRCDWLPVSPAVAELFVLYGLPVPTQSTSEAPAHAE